MMLTRVATVRCSTRTIHDFVQYIGSYKQCAATTRPESETIESFEEHACTKTVVHWFVSFFGSCPQPQEEGKVNSGQVNFLVLVAVARITTMVCTYYVGRC